MNIDDLIESCKAIVENLKFDNELHAPDEIGLSTAADAIYDALWRVDAIKTVQGTERIRIGKSIANNKEQVKVQLNVLGVCLKAIIAGLNQNSENSLTKAEVKEIIQANGEDDNYYYAIIAILASLDLATSAGRSRTGGIKTYDGRVEKEQINEAIHEIESQPADSIRQIKAREDKESVLYPLAAKEISNLGYEAIIMGVRRRLPGEWNTPDVMGYKINRFENIGGAEVEIVTVEVKWVISKLAIAESNSHQRLGHKTYLMVYQTFDEIDKEFLPKLVSVGLGLICKNEGGFKIYLPPRRNNINNEEIDEFLGQALQEEAISSIKKELAKYFYLDFNNPVA